MLKWIILTMSVAILSACSAQINRDNLRYNGAYRGWEKYELDNIDSLKAAEERAKLEIDLYERHKKASYFESSNNQGTMPFEKLAQAGKEQNQVIPNSVTTFLPGDLAPESKSGINDTAGNKIKIAGSTFSCYSSGSCRGSELERIWPKDLLLAIVDKVSTSNTTGDATTMEQFISALSSTASIAQIRDLSTEPNFPSLLPKKREVILSCLPPPESAAFEAATKLSAYFKQQDKLEAGVTGEFKTAVVKLFEESERTLFLQYALFRLCEMSINAPSGFRNVFPVIVHDIVRRTAEMNLKFTEVAEKRLMEEEKTKQAKIAAELEKDKAYFACLKDTLDKKQEDITAKMKICNQAIYQKGATDATK